MSDGVAEFARTHIAGTDVWTLDDMPPALLAAMGQAGLFRIGLPEAHGGTGGGYPAIAAAEQTLMAVGGIAGIGTIFGSHQMVARYYFADHASPAQQAQYLPALASGALTVAVAISEPEVGAHPKKLTTAAHRTAADCAATRRRSVATRRCELILVVIFLVVLVLRYRRRH